MTPLRNLKSTPSSSNINNNSNNSNSNGNSNDNSDGNSNGNKVVVIVIVIVTVVRKIAILNVESRSELATRPLESSPRLPRKTPPPSFESSTKATPGEEMGYRYPLGLSWGNIRVIVRLYWGNIRVTLGVILRLYWGTLGLC